MRRLLTSLLVLPALLLAASCNRTLEPDSTFIATQGIQLKVMGSVIHTYDPLTWQLGYKPSSKEFRVGDDSMKNWYTVTCSKIPSRVGDKFDATVTWSAGLSSNSVQGSFEVAKVEGDRYWLWCGEKKIQTGVTVCILR